MKWDYYVTENENNLNLLGQQGWELVTVLQSENGQRFYFKKPSSDLKERITEEQRREVYSQLNLEDAT